ERGERSGERGTAPAGARVVVDTLREAGVPLDGVRVADGSGLSALDRMTAETLGAILRVGESEPTIRGPVLDPPAVAGVDGTLKHRLQSRPARSRVIAKTGTTNRASA